jgi:hypothetical protein
MADAIAAIDARPRSVRVAGFAIAVWSLAYMLPHLYWALGGGCCFVALHPSVGSLPQWRTINWIASFVLNVAALLGVGFVAWRGAAARRLLWLGAWLGWSIAAAHGLIGIWTRLIEVREMGPAKWLLWDLLVFEPWFLIEGILFGVAGYLSATGRKAKVRWIVGCAVGLAIALVAALLRVKVG